MRLLSTIIVPSILVLIVIFQTGCNDNPALPQNQPPVILNLESIPASSATNRISHWVTVTFTVNVRDPDNTTNLQYRWSATRGTFNAGTPATTMIWQPPKVSGDALDTITVAVSDGKATVSKSIVVFLAPPQPPTLQAPSNFAIIESTSPSLSWLPCGGATSYALRVATDRSFTHVVYDDSGLTSTRRQLSTLSNGQVYYWAVRATKDSESTGWPRWPTWFPERPVAWVFTTYDACRGTRSVSYEGKTYHAVSIGSQCWLKENLDVGRMISRKSEPAIDTVVEKYCYDDYPANCAKYGGLYRFGEAMNGTTRSAQGICPSGWHVPTNDEFRTLDSTAGYQNALVAVGQGSGGYAGNNASKFSAMLAGFLWSYDFWGHRDVFIDSGLQTAFWNSSGGFFAVQGDEHYERFLRDYRAFSVRCVKDKQSMTDKRNSFRPSVMEQANASVSTSVPDIVLPDSSGNAVSLKCVDSARTLIVFYESSCSHCQEMIPLLAKLPGNTVHVFAVSLDDNRTEWVNFIRANKLRWTNVNDPLGWEGKTAAEYSVSAIPMMILVNRDKKVIAKPLTIEELTEYL